MALTLPRWTRSAGAVMNPVGAATYRRAGDHHEQEEQCRDSGRVEQAAEEPNRKKPAGRREQHTRKAVSPPHGTREMP